MGYHGHQGCDPLDQVWFYVRITALAGALAGGEIHEQQLVA